MSLDGSKSRRAVTSRATSPVQSSPAQSTSGKKLLLDIQLVIITVMPSSRALRLLQTGARISQTASRAPRRVEAIRNGYCTACEPAPPPSPVKRRYDRPKLFKPPKNPKNPKEPETAPDHRQLGVKQELFTTSIYSPGSPIFLPNGTRIFNKLTDFLRTQYEHFGFQEVITPTIYKKSLWEKSGHWENYAEDMYSVTGRGASGEKEGRQVGEDEEYGLKPMNCPGHCLIFASKQRSYRDLPIRFADFSPLHRNEISGALSGLTRVRRFHQDDGHIFCRPSQIREEISKTLEFVKLTYGVLGLGPYRLALSTRPKDSFIGTVEEWDNAEAALRESLDASEQPWTLNEGDGAFYGPKIDIILKDSDGKEHQTATIQLDFQLPKRFELEYHAPAPEIEQKGLTTDDAELLSVQGSVTPVLIHRAVLGSVERIMALLIEHHNGRWPFWLNPRQVKILTVNDQPETLEFVKKIVQDLQGYDPPGTDGEGRGLGALGAGLVRGNRLSIDVDDSPRGLNKKISEAKLQQYGVTIIVGARNVESNRLSVDFAAIPDYRYDVRESKLLNNLLVAQKEAKLERDARYPNWGRHGAPVDEEFASQDGDPAPRKLSYEELKAFEITARTLRKVLNGFQTSYV
ncbi:putative threonine--tRNA ligase, mitochondrial [Lachnellula willkommii]|uniref:threonine--tRNA ligase n=1 Tax=Lachnellula willkommii TaxID=215461 RepID=A0A559MMF1_9HELO|nr:putative threonine--tRNA ligase, mitochondrial [Lachnellula willkommii]